ncbi:MAG: DUF983 domain-containing protein [Chloroflexota bacterium]|nr:DUF983 domain-containing protein [Dehalococcoidia bacterium]MDW8253736.1 DUF983 domain-containing protein [Chloroflexota bacterium]
MRRLLQLFGRAALLRCPNCGRAPLFRSWFGARDHCTGCGLRFEREEGFHTGGMALNLVASELVFVAVLVGLVVATWPNPPWDLLRWGALLLMVAFPLFFYPFSKAFWLALDLAIRPIEPIEIVPLDDWGLAGNSNARATPSAPHGTPHVF